MMEVQLFQYDLSGGWGKTWSKIVTGMPEAIWHVSVVLYNSEFSYNCDKGINLNRVPSLIEDAPDKKLTLGFTGKSIEEINDFIMLAHEEDFRVPTYDLFENNCIHFANKFSLFLLNEELPKDIIELPGKFAKLKEDSFLIRFLCWCSTRNWFNSSGYSSRSFHSGSAAHSYSFSESPDNCSSNIFLEKENTYPTDICILMKKFFTDDMKNDKRIDMYKKCYRERCIKDLSEVEECT